MATTSTSSSNGEGEEIPIPPSVLDNYQQFLSKEFNVTNYTSNVLKISSIPTSLEKLSIGKREVTEELNEKISLNYQDLFNQATHIKDFDQEIEELRNGLNNLEASISRMKSDISEPFLNAKSKVVQLKRVQESCELLRIIIRFLSSVKKLKAHLKDGRDLAKAAQSIHEINSIMKENDLNGIDIIDSQVHWINQCKDQVVTTSSNLILKGMESQNQTEVANSLQVFYNLGILSEKVNFIVNTTTEKVTRSIKVMLSVNKLVMDNNQQQQQQGNIGKQQQPQQQPKTTNVQSDQQSIWSKIDGVTDSLYTSCVHIIQLQRVLSKIRDPTTHKSLMESMISSNNNNNNNKNNQSTSTTTTTLSIIEGNNILQSFWKTITKVLETNLTVAAKSSTIVENTFISEYPRISRSFQDFSKRLQNYCDIHEGIGAFDHSLLFKAISIFERGYLERAKNRLVSAVGSLFPQSAWTRGSIPSGIPTSKQLVDLSRTIWVEIESIVDGGDSNLVIRVAKVISSVLDLFSGKIESLIQQTPQIEMLPESRPTSSQLTNCALFNCATQLYSSVQSLLKSHSSIPKEAVEIIDNSLKMMKTISDHITQPLINSFVYTVGNIIARANTEDWINVNNNQPVSEYMEQLQQFTTNFHTQYLGKLTPCQSLSTQIKSAVSQIILSFLRHCSLIRGMSEKGKLRMANDLTHLELSMTPLVTEGLKELGSVYQWMRTFRHFLFKDLSGVSELKDAIDVHSLPTVIIAHCLMSRAPKEMVFPHIILNCTIPQYVHWLNEHNESESMQLIKKAIDNYVQTVNRKGEKEYSYIYPLVLSLIPK